MNDQEYLVRKIRTQYTEKEHTALDELRRFNGLSRLVWAEGWLTG